MATAVSGVEVTGPAVPGTERVLTLDALAFVADLHREFNPRRTPPRAARVRQHRIDAGELLDFLADTARDPASATGASPRPPRTCTTGGWRSPGPPSGR